MKRLKFLWLLLLVNHVACAPHGQGVWGETPQQTDAASSQPLKLRPAVTISDQQVNEVRAVLAKLQYAKDVSNANAIRRAYQATITGMLKIGAAIEDSQNELRAQARVDAMDHTLLPCLCVLSMDNNRDLAFLADDHVDELLDSMPVRSNPMPARLAIVAALEKLSNDPASSYSTAATLYLRHEYPFAKTRSLTVATLLSLLNHRVPSVRVQAVRELSQYPQEADKIVPQIKRIDDDFLRSYISTTMAALDPSGTDTIAFLKDRAMGGKPSYLGGLAGCASVDDNALKALGEFYASDPSELRFTQRMSDHQRSQLAVRLKSQSMHWIEKLSPRGEELLPYLEKLMRWRADDRVDHEHTNLRIATAWAMTNFGASAIPYLQRVLQAGVDEALIGLATVDSKNGEQYVGQIVQTLRTGKMPYEKEIAYHSALAKLGQEAESAAPYLLQEFDKTESVLMLDSITETLQKLGPSSAKAITDRLVERVQRLKSGEEKSRLRVSHVIKHVGGAGEQSLSAAKMLQESLSSSDRYEVEGAVGALIDLAKACPQYRDQIVKVLCPLLKIDGYARMVTRELESLDVPLPVAHAPMAEALRHTDLDTIRICLAECLLETGGYQEALDALAEALDGGKFSDDSYFNEAKELKAQAQRLANQDQPTVDNDAMIIPIQRLIANERMLFAFETLSEAGPAANGAIETLESILDDRANPTLAAYSALTLLKINPKHERASATIARLQRTPNLYAQQVIRDAK